MFSVLQADPPWKFRDEKTGGNHVSGAVQKYPVMDLGAIMSLPVQSIMATPSVCFLWVPTALKFSHGGPVLAAWGYPYKTTVYWDKQKLGMGHWFRNTVEELLVGIRGGDHTNPDVVAMARRIQDGIERWVVQGHPLDDQTEELLVGLRGDYPPFGCQLPNILHLPPGEHSAKPEEFHRLMETATGITSSRYNVELFARRQVPGWTGLGNQVTGRTIQEDLLRLARVKRCTTWQPIPAVSDMPVRRCACSGELEEHSQAVIDAVSSGLAALALRSIGDQAAGR